MVPSSFQSYLKERTCEQSHKMRDFVPIGPRYRATITLSSLLNRRHLMMPGKGDGVESFADRRILSLALYQSLLALYYS